MPLPATTTSRQALAEAAYQAYYTHHALAHPVIFVEHWKDLDQEERDAWELATLTVYRLIHEGVYL